MASSELLGIPGAAWGEWPYTYDIVHALAPSPTITLPLSLASGRVWGIQGWGGSTVGRAPALHLADSGLIIDALQLC